MAALSPDSVGRSRKFPLSYTAFIRHLLPMRRFCRLRPTSLHTGVIIQSSQGKGGRSVNFRSNEWRAGLSLAATR